MTALSLGLACCGLCVTWLALYPLCVYLVRRRVVDVPNARSSHVHSTPRGGGLVIVGVTLCGWLLHALLTQSPSWDVVLGFTAGAVLVAGIGWLDDLLSLPVWLRFGVQSLAAALALACFGCWQTISLPLLDTIPLGWLGKLLSFLWILGLINAYNFMDGIDGIAGVQAVAAGLGWAVMGWQLDQAPVGVLGLMLAATSLGFLGHNWSPARIFLGDVGSTFLGYSFAVLPLLTVSVQPPAMVGDRVSLAGVLFLWPFLVDTTFTLLRRLWRGENIFRAHRSHLYQRLVIAGASHRAVAVLYLALAFISVLLGCYWFQGGQGSAIGVILVSALLSMGLWGGFLISDR